MSERARKTGVILLTAAGILLCLSVLLRTDPAGIRSFNAETRDPVCIQSIFLPDGGTVCANTDNAEELYVLPGIGEATADAWITEYTLNGPFFYPEDILSVRGIGEKKLDAFRNMIDLSVQSE